MNSKKLIGMAAVLAVLAGIALIQTNGAAQRTPRPGAESDTLFQDVSLNSIDGINISQASNSVALVKQDGKWVNTSLYNYPVDFSKLSVALSAAAEVKTGRPVRATNVDEAEFGMDAPTTLVLKSGEHTAAKLEIGAQRNPSETAGWASQHFVRKNEQKEIYLVDFNFQSFTADATDWIDHELLNVNPADIVSVQAGDAELKAGDSGWELADLDSEREELQTAEADKLRRALQYLKCTTIVDPEKTAEDTGFSTGETYVARDKSGQVYHVTVGGETEGGRAVRIAVTYEKPEKTEPREEQRKKVEELNTRLESWTYVISSSDAADLLIDRSRIVKEKPAGEPGETENTKVTS